MAVTEVTCPHIGLRHVEVRAVRRGERICRSPVEVTRLAWVNGCGRYIATYDDTNHKIDPAPVDRL
jgi:hypothetical protein